MRSRQVGDRIGMLTVLSKEGYKEYKSCRVALYRCLCDCGNEIVKTSSNLSTQKSCGCLRTKREDLTGKVFGKLTVDRFHSSGKRADNWLCRCECGREVVKSATYLRVYKGSCGCDNSGRIKHGHAVGGKHSPEYSVWSTMVGRCTRETDSAYQFYGAKGITLCDRWDPKKGGSFENFLEDMGERPDGTSIDRIDTNGNYEPSNCRWATDSIQGFNQNRRSTNKSGRTGVCWNKTHLKWEAYITKDRKKIGLGFYSKLEDAIRAREQGELKYFGWIKE